MAWIFPWTPQKCSIVWWAHPVLSNPVGIFVHEWARYIVSGMGPPEQAREWTGCYTNCGPQIDKKQNLQSLHNSPTGGHLGENRIVNRVCRRFYWTGYKADVVRWCKHYDNCAMAKPGPRRKRAQLGQVPIAAPLECIALDVMGPLPQAENGHMYILVLADYFTKWAEAYALKDCTIADVLVEQFVSRFGDPRSLHSDQGREFESDLIAHLCKLLHINKTRTVPFNPKSDDLVERDNRTVEQILTVTTMVNKARNDRDDHLSYIMMAYRASVHEVTKCTPNLLMLNDETNLPIDLMIRAPVCPIQYVKWSVKLLSTLFSLYKTIYKPMLSGKRKCMIGRVVFQNLKLGPQSGCIILQGVVWRLGRDGRVLI